MTTYGKKPKKPKKFFLAALALSILTVSGTYLYLNAYAQDRSGWLGHFFFIQTDPEMRFNGTLKFQTYSGSTLLALSGGGSTPGALYQPMITFGVAGTPVSQFRMYRANLTPTASSLGLVLTYAHASAWSQTFTVTGLDVKDTIFINPPAPTVECPMYSGRVTTADTLSLTFNKSTNLNCTPAAGVYSIFAIRT